MKARPAVVTKFRGTVIGALFRAEDPEALAALPKLAAVLVVVAALTLRDVELFPVATHVIGESLQLVGPKVMGVITHKTSSLPQPS